MTALILSLPRPHVPQEAGAFDFKFEELGTEVERGFVAGSFNGTAEINWFYEDGELKWFVDDITLDCSKWTGITYEHEIIKLEKDSNLYHAIWTELTDGSAKDAVQAKVEEQR